MGQNSLTISFLFLELPIEIVPPLVGQFQPISSVLQLLQGNCDKRIRRVERRFIDNCHAIQDPDLDVRAGRGRFYI